MSKSNDRLSSQLWKVFRSLWSRPFIGLALFFIGLILLLPILTYWLFSLGSTKLEQKEVYVERIQQINELATAEAYTKALIEREDNELFGKSIGVNLPGTKRKLLVVIPGSVRAGVNLAAIQKQAIQVDEEKKTLQVTLPPATLLAGTELNLEQVEIFSHEGLFRTEATIDEAYELATEAKKMIREEAVNQGILGLAEQHAITAVEELLAVTGYEVTVKIEE